MRHAVCYSSGDGIVSARLRVFPRPTVAARSHMGDHDCRGNCRLRGLRSHAFGGTGVQGGHLALRRREAPALRRPPRGAYGGYRGPELPEREREYLDERSRLWLRQVHLVERPRRLLCPRAAACPRLPCRGARGRVRRHHTRHLHRRFRRRAGDVPCVRPDEGRYRALLHRRRRGKRVLRGRRHIGVHRGRRLRCGPALQRLAVQHAVRLPRGHRLPCVRRPLRGIAAAAERCALHVELPSIVVLSRVPLARGCGPDSGAERKLKLGRCVFAYSRASSDRDAGSATISARSRRGSG
jgi:hypothetical protein